MLLAKSPKLALYAGERRFYPSQYRLLRASLGLLLPGDNLLGRRQRLNLPSHFAQGLRGFGKTASQCFDCFRLSPELCSLCDLVAVDLDGFHTHKLYFDGLFASARGSFTRHINAPK